MEFTAETPLLRRFSIPPAFTQPGVEHLADKGELGLDTVMPAPAALALARHDKDGLRLPQAIAHRGYKAKFPENTMSAFAGAVDVGAHAVETDVHITRDEVVVLSHDATLKRCFGRPEKVIDCDWSFISTLWTTQEPRQRMPRLLDLLEYLARPENAEIWCILDIKLDNDAKNIMRLIAQTIASAPPSPSKPWSSRIVLGCWAAKYVPLATHYLRGFPISHIGFSTAYARQFFKVPHVGFSMLLSILMAPGGRKFIADAHAEQRPVLAWTVNDDEKMEWCVRRGLDGVLTDDPKRFLEICEHYRPEAEEPSLSWWIWMDVIRLWVLVLVFGVLYRNRFVFSRALRWAR